MEFFLKSCIFLVKHDLVIVFSSSNAVNVIVIYVVVFEHKKNTSFTIKVKKEAKLTVLFLIFYKFY